MPFGGVVDVLDGCVYTVLYTKPGSRPVLPDPPNKKNCLPARLGPGIPGAIPEMASSWLLDHPLEAIAV